MVDDRAKDEGSVRSPHDFLAAPLWVRHHAEDVAGMVYDAGDIVDRTVWVGVRGRLPRAVGVSKYYPASVLQFADRFGVCEVVSFPMGYWDSQYSSVFYPPREGGLGRFRANGCPFAAELECVVSGQSTWEEACLAEDLKPVAYADDDSSLFCKIHDSAHHRREPCDGAAAEVIAV